MTNLEHLLLHHEGVRLKPYYDTVGKLTIGVGRNLTDVGISQAEAMEMFDSDIERAKKEATQIFPIDALDEVRFAVVVSMVFNMGLAGFKGFVGTIDAIKAKDYEGAATHMLASQWAKQVGQRADDLATMMRTGQWLAGI